MTILAPLTIPIEKHVVIDIVDGIAQTDLLHLPAPVHMARRGDGRTIATRFGDRMERGFPPASWPAACGAFTHGSIYVQAGPLADKTVCPDCAKRVGRSNGKKPTARASVLALLADGPLTVAEIAQLRGSSQNAAAVAVCRLKADGHVRKVGAAYALKEAA